MRSNPVLRFMVGFVFCFFSLLGFSGHCLAQGLPPAAPATPPEHTLTIPFASNPQPTPQTTPQGTAPDYSKEAYVIDRYDISATFQAEGTWQQVATVVVQVTSQAGILQFGNLSIPYESRNQKVEFTYIRIRKPDGSIVETPSAYTQDMPAGVTLQAPMYSDLHIKQVPVTNLNPGDTLMYQYKIDQFQPEVPNQFWLAQNFFKAGIVLEQHVEIRVPSSKYVQVQSADVQPTIRREGDVTVYDWKTSHLHPEPSDRRSLALKADEKPSIQMTTFENWQQVGDWYHSLQSSRVVVTPAIQQKEQELTKGLTTDDAKQRAIYAYVATQFRYIGLSFGIGRYQPHSADEVLQNKFGDCKDKHTLFAALMKAAGYDVSPALIGSATKLDESIPYPGQFDHLISVLHQGAIWDTVGWIDFKQANYSDAERYLRSAWLLSQNADVADHLRKTYEKEGKLVEARHMQKLAAASRPNRVVRVGKNGIVTGLPSPNKRAENEKYVLEVQKLRTTEISGLPKKMASAQFWLVFTPQGLEEVKMISGDATLSEAADQMKKHKYPQTFPDPGPVKIVRRGILSCSQFDPTCQLVLLQPQWTQL